MAERGGFNVNGVEDSRIANGHAKARIGPQDNRPRLSPIETTQSVFRSSSFLMRKQVAPIHRVKLLSGEFLETKVLVRHSSGEMNQDVSRLPPRSEAARPR